MPCFPFIVMVVFFPFFHVCIFDVPNSFFFFLGHVIPSHAFPSRCSCLFSLCAFHLFIPSPASSYPTLLQVPGILNLLFPCSVCVLGYSSQREFSGDPCLPSTTLVAPMSMVHVSTAHLLSSVGFDWFGLPISQHTLCSCVPDFRLSCVF